MPGSDIPVVDWCLIGISQDNSRGRISWRQVADSTMNLASWLVSRGRLALLVILVPVLRMLEKTFQRFRRDDLPLTV